MWNRQTAFTLFGSVFSFLLRGQCPDDANFLHRLSVVLSCWKKCTDLGCETFTCLKYLWFDKWLWSCHKVNTFIWDFWECGHIVECQRHSTCIRILCPESVQLGCETNPCAHVFVSNQFRWEIKLRCC